MAKSSTKTDKAAVNRRFSASLNQLYRLQNNYQPEALAEKVKLLSLLKALNTSRAKVLQAYFRFLLFHSAYPPNLLIYRHCIAELSRFHERLNSLPKKELSRLEQSGLPGSSMHGVYSYTLLDWLNRENLIQAELLSFDEDALHPGKVLRSYFLEAEFELLSHEGSDHLNWLKEALGKNEKQILGSLLQQVTLKVKAESDRDAVFESLRPIVQFTCGDFVLPLSFEKHQFFHADGLKKKVDSVSTMNSQLPPKLKLSLREQTELLRTARLCLLYLNRETDPVTNAYPGGLEYYRLERGFSLAFFSQKPERRLPFESYIGFMMFKNGLPLAYGGAWIFGQKSLLGINIFEAYRGGESAYLFSLLLGGYRQRFSVSSIEVEAYQFGLDNPEGIKTGAFWFYYRFGFRPVDPHLRTIAAREFKKIGNSGSYKSPFNTLKAFTASNMVLEFESPEQIPDTSTLSRYISQSINHFFDGNRLDFKKKATAKLQEELGLDYNNLSKTEKLGYDKLLPFISLCLDYKNMKEQDRHQLRELILEKGRSEFRFTELCAAFPFSRFLKKIS